MTSTKSISVALPCKDDPNGVLATLTAYSEQATDRHRLQFAVVDDGSVTSPVDETVLARTAADLGVGLKFERQAWTGVAGARNRAASLCDGDIMVITDCHVAPSSGWDTEIERTLRPDLVLALTIADRDSGFRGYGCSLVVPFMGTRWNRERDKSPSKVVVASSAGTALYRSLFERLGGFDEGMQVYGGIEPEFSVRAWLAGAEIRSLPSVQIFHDFKTQEQVKTHLDKNRTNMVHNSLRFGCCYLDDERTMQMLRYYSKKFPDEFPEALSRLNNSDVWERRDQLEAMRVRSFSWLSQHLRIYDHAGFPVWIPVADLQLSA